MTHPAFRLQGKTAISKRWALSSAGAVHLHYELETCEALRHVHHLRFSLCKAMLQVCGDLELRERELLFTPLSTGCHNFRASSNTPLPKKKLLAASLTRAAHTNNAKKKKKKKTKRISDVENTQERCAVSVRRNTTHSKPARKRKNGIGLPVFLEIRTCANARSAVKFQRLKRLVWRRVVGTARDSLLAGALMAGVLAVSAVWVSQTDDIKGFPPMFATLIRTTDDFVA